jgi:uncharacterized membrane protein
MAAEAYTLSAPILGSTVPTVWSRPARRSLFGDAALILFLLAQCFDGVFTYVGVASFGLSIEGNPIIVALMTTFGQGVALIGAKTVAGVLGICLHLREVHGAVAALTGLYLAAAIVPWTALLFF